MTEPAVDDRRRPAPGPAPRRGRGAPRAGRRTGPRAARPSRRGPSSRPCGRHRSVSGRPRHRSAAAGRRSGAGRRASRPRWSRRGVLDRAQAPRSRAGSTRQSTRSPTGPVADPGRPPAARVTAALERGEADPRDVHGANPFTTRLRQGFCRRGRSRPPRSAAGAAAPPPGATRRGQLGRPSTTGRGRPSITRIHRVASIGRPDRASVTCGWNRPPSPPAPAWCRPRPAPRWRSGAAPPRGPRRRPRRRRTFARPGFGNAPAAGDRQTPPPYDARRPAPSRSSRSSRCRSATSPQEGQRDVPLLRDGPAQPVAGLLPRGQELLEVLQGRLRRRQGDEHAHTDDVSRAVV